MALTLSDCSTLSEDALREHLELELQTLALSDADARLQFRCEGTTVVIELSRASGERYPVEVRVELRDTAKAARERLVALSASELVAQAERALAAAEAAEATSVSHAASVKMPEKSANLARLPAASLVPHRPRVELFVAGNVARVGDPSLVLWGGSLGTRWALSRRWSVLLDTRFERGNERLRLADVRWTSLSGFAGAAAAANAGPLLLSAGVGVRAGWLALAATSSPPNEGRGLTAPWAGVALPLRLAFEVGGTVLPFVGAEVGSTSRCQCAAISMTAARARPAKAWAVDFRQRRCRRPSLSVVGSLGSERHPVDQHDDVVCWVVGGALAGVPVRARMPRIVDDFDRLLRHSIDAGQRIHTSWLAPFQHHEKADRVGVPIEAELVQRIGRKQRRRSERVVRCRPA